MPSEIHEHLNLLAAGWAKRQGFSVVATNLWAAGSRERVDVIAFHQTSTLLIESKVSRSDFFNDRKKPERASGGVGLYRFYITPFNMVSLQEVPQDGGSFTPKAAKCVRLVSRPGIYGPLLIRRTGNGRNISIAPTSKQKPPCSLALRVAPPAVRFSTSRRYPTDLYPQ